MSAFAPSPSDDAIPPAATTDHLHQDANDTADRAEHGSSARGVRLISRIRAEEVEADDPFLARRVRLSGYDYYGELLGRINPVEMLWLLLTGHAPQAAQSAMLADLAVALADPGPREPSVHAAMCAAVGGSPSAAALMAALAVGSGHGGGAADVTVAMNAWEAVGEDFTRFPGVLAATSADLDTWAGHQPHARITAQPVRDTLDQLGRSPLARRLAWMKTELAALQHGAGAGLGFAGVAAAAFADLGLDPVRGEALYLLLRLPGALAHALDHADLGHRQFPFFHWRPPQTASSLASRERDYGHE